ncbi:hypothetical protein PIN31009_04097 [Pandoraea iniqua]|uniref:Uncharacterized protein n=1 Tax=Pandoraea iniqua TaxID=2508288 RepID=A0A5E4XWL5_9BURK|nr:hypothetical protein [Pandoraea iniqua]VVE40643.1 hypothetical protein PIN31009_04097 [Pandoraea iniqua]VVE48877.1 hypothetical protein PIN31115_04548 [Pandoraea iniqua]
MSSGIGAPGAALHRAWRLPGQGTAATVGTRRASSSPDRFTNALRSLSGVRESAASEPVQSVQHTAQDPAVAAVQSSASLRELGRA